MNLLEISGLNKSYGKKKVLTDVSMTLNQGEIMGLIGANGAGKTTILKTILGMVNKESGSIKINQQVVTKKDKSYLKAIGSIIEYPTFYEGLTAYQNLRLIANLYECPLTKEASWKALATVGLQDSADKQVSSFSLGMKQRLGLAQALVHRPSILLLDEPFNGLDPKGMKDFRQLFLGLAQKGVGIIVSSHSLEELNKLVATVTIIDKGQVVFQGKKADYLALGAKHSTWLLETDDPETTIQILKHLQIPYQWTGQQFELSIAASSEKALKNKLLASLLERQVAIVNISEHQENFEDIFLNLSKKMEVSDESFNKD